MTAIGKILRRELRAKGFIAKARGEH